jgi:hypothetical protein
MVVLHPQSTPDMAKKPIPHPILLTCRLRLRQFREDDADAMHECFGDPDVMRFWNLSVHTKRIETERAVRNYINCTPSYYRFWAVADAGMGDVWHDEMLYALLNTDYVSHEAKKSG